MVIINCECETQEDADRIWDAIMKLHLIEKHSGSIHVSKKLVTRHTQSSLGIPKKRVFKLKATGRKK